MSILRTTKEFVVLFNEHTDELSGTITTRTPVKMNKKDVETKTIANPHDEVFKIQTVAVTFNPKYETKVNEQRLTEGKEQDFAVESRKWGTPVNGSIVAKGDQLYLSVIEDHKVLGATYETEDGTVVNYDDLKPFIPAYSGSVKQDFNTEIKFRTFKLDNVVSAVLESIDVEYVK